VLYAVNVRLNRFTYRRIEIDDTGQIHHNINLPLELLELFEGYAAERLVQIAFHDPDFLPNDVLTADTLDDRTQWWRLQDLGIETLFTGQVLFAAYLYDQMFQFRESIEEHRQQNLADKTGAAEKQRCPIAERLDCRDLAGSSERRRIPLFVFAANGIPSPGG